MTANQRRTGFRLPWTSEDEASSAGTAEASRAEPVAAPENGGRDATSDTAGPSSEPAAAAPATGAGDEPDSSAGDSAPPPPSEPEPSTDFLRELVGAMRRVAAEAKQAGIADARSRAEERLKEMEAEAARRHEELKGRAEADIAAVGEWAKAEAERIKAEAERRVAERRAELEEQLAADRARGETESRAVRDRISEYERELEAFHAQLAEISDPAAFAAAAKRMPRPPVLGDAGPDAAASIAAPPERTGEPGPAEGNLVSWPAPEVHPAEEEVLAARLAELDAKLPAAQAPASAPAPVGDPWEVTTTEMVVTGLGSFGAITSFRQSLADVDGIEGVGLSLGQSGEFIFRATHRAGFDVRTAIEALEGSAATIEPRAEGGLLVKLERAR